MRFLFKYVSTIPIDSIDGEDFFVDEATYQVLSLELAVPPPPRSRCRCCDRRAPAIPIAQPDVWEAEVERTEGKFQSREDVWFALAEQLGEVEELDSPGHSE